MEALEAIKTRRSIGKVKPDPVPQELIEQILEAGTFAPNHKRTEPWRFFVMTGEGRNKLGAVLGEIAKAGCDDPEAEESRQKIAKAEQGPLRAPVIIAVGMEPADKPNVMVEEEFAAVHAAAENMLIAAHALGLGAVWRTGGNCYHEKVKQFFGLSEKGSLVALIYLGWPDMETKEKKLTGYKELTTWIGE